MVAESVIPGNYRVVVSRAGTSSTWQTASLAVCAPLALATGGPLIVMELMEGESLAQRLVRVKRLTPRETIAAISPLVRTLSNAHDAGIVHGDLNPENVVLVRNEDMEMTKLLGFPARSGARLLGTDASARAASPLGHPHYMSPEQISGSKHLDYRADLWSLGVIVCECLTGRRPFDADGIGALVLQICTEPIPTASTLGSVPRGFDVWLSRALSRDVARRFQSVRELVGELERLCSLEAAAFDAAAFDAASMEEAEVDDDDIFDDDDNLETQVVAPRTGSSARYAPPHTPPRSAAWPPSERPFAHSRVARQTDYDASQKPRSSSRNESIPPPLPSDAPVARTRPPAKAKVNSRAWVGSALWMLGGVALTLGAIAAGFGLSRGRLAARMALSPAPALAASAALPSVAPAAAPSLAPALVAPAAAPNLAQAPVVVPSVAGPSVAGPSALPAAVKEPSAPPVAATPRAAQAAPAVAPAPARPQTQAAAPPIARAASAPRQALPSAAEPTRDSCSASVLNERE